jgi:hypothetical protein
MQVADLNQLYNDAETYSHELFAEMRSNILLVSGNHYTRRGHRFWRSLRSSENLSRQQKLRLTKNHLQKIIKSYQNNLVNLSPGVSIGPNNEREMQDIKSADLNGAVWEDIKRTHKIKGFTRSLAKDFLEIGEFWVKIFYDTSAGKFLGDYPEIDQETGLPVLDEDENIIESPQFAGDLVFERVHGFNMLVDPDARSYEEARWVVVRKMLPVRDLRYRYRDDPGKLSYINKSAESTYKVFDGNSGKYLDSKGMTMVREYYFRPNSEYPNGYYYIATEAGVLHHGELPLGLWPFVYKGFDELTTSARAYSLIKQLRPYQAEINRSGSKIAEHQITIGDDKVVTQSGATLSPGAIAHGVKHIKTNGQITVIPGRSGEQYLPYMQSQITEMYQVAGVVEDSQKETNQLDPYALLFRSLKEKKSYTVYSDKFEEGLVEMAELALRLKRAYITDEELIPMIGKNEYVNIQEFRQSIDLSYQIKIDPQANDIETKMGKQLTFNQILQYVGPQMAQKDVGKLIKMSPYANSEKGFDEFTIDYEIATNVILALDRGEYPEVQESEDHVYMQRKLNHRKKQPDFVLLPDQIKGNYDRRINEHKGVHQKMQQEAARLSAGFIPTGGYLVTCDFYVPDAEKPEQSKRARVPYESLAHLLKVIEQQGMTQATLQKLPLPVQASMGRELGQGLPPGPPSQMVPNPSLQLI